MLFIHKLISLLSTMKYNFAFAIYFGGIIPYIVHIMQMSKEKICGRLNYFFKAQIEMLQLEYNFFFLNKK